MQWKIKLFQNQINLCATVFYQHGAYCSQEMFCLKCLREQKCYKVIQRLRVTCFIAGQYLTEECVRITDVI